MILLRLFITFFKIGAFSFGGGYAMIPLIEREVVEIYKWLPIDEFLDIIAISQMTPGPIAVNSATFVGYKIAGFWGSIVATIGVALPSFILITLISVFMERYRNITIVDSFFQGVRPAVIALIVQAAFSVGKNSFSSTKDFLIAIAVCIGIYQKINPIMIIVFTAISGILIY